MNRMMILKLALITFAGSASAGWFGPSNYEECILDNMKGVTSNAAAIAIASACRSQFPEPPPPPPTPEELAKQKKRNEECWRKYDKDVAEYERTKKLWEQRNSLFPFYGSEPVNWCGAERP